MLERHLVAVTFQLTHDEDQSLMWKHKNIHIKWHSVSFPKNLIQIKDEQSACKTTETTNEQKEQNEGISQEALDERQIITMDVVLPERSSSNKTVNNGPSET